LGDGIHYVSVQIRTRNGRTSFATSPAIVVDGSTPVFTGEEDSSLPMVRPVATRYERVSDLTGNDLRAASAHYVRIGAIDPELGPGQWLHLAWSPADDQDAPVVAFEVCVSSQWDSVPSCGAYGWVTIAGGASSLGTSLDLSSSSANATVMCMASPACHRMSRSAASQEWHAAYDAAVAAAVANGTMNISSPADVGMDESMEFAGLPDQVQALVVRVRAISAAGFSVTQASDPIVLLTQDDVQERVEYEQNKTVTSPPGGESTPPSSGGTDGMEWNQPEGPLVVAAVVDESDLAAVLDADTSAPASDGNATDNSTVPGGNAQQTVSASWRGLILPSALSWVEAARPLTDTEVVNTTAVRIAGRAVASISAGGNSAVGIGRANDQIRKLWENGFGIAIGFSGVAGSEGQISDDMASSVSMDAIEAKLAEASAGSASSSQYQVFSAGPGLSQPPLVQIELAIGTSKGESDIRSFSNQGITVERRSLVLPEGSSAEATQMDVDAGASWYMSSVRISELRP